MKRIVKAALLTCAAVALPSVSFAQAAPAAAGQCQLPDAEYQVYNNASTQAQPAAKAAALEAYLTQFPNSCVKKDVLDTLAKTYAAIPDNAKAIHAADQILQLNPNDFSALGYEVYLHYASAAAITDPDPKAKLPELDQAASYAQKGLAAPKPAGVADDVYATAKENIYPLFYRAIAFDAFNKGDFATAVDNYKKELAFIAADPKLAPQLQTPGDPLLDTFYLSEAYMQTQPADYLDCAFYAARASAFAPDAFKAKFTPVGQYCYKKYHGKVDGYDQLVTLASANVTPPANLATTVTPAPTPAEIIADILKTTPPDQLATADKEYILQNGSPDQVQTVWNTMKGKSFQFPDLLVVSSTPQQVQVAVSDDAKQSKTADFTFNMTAPEAVPDLPAKATPAQKVAHAKAVKKAADQAAAIADATQPGKTVTLSGTFDSYTPKPFMITMTDGAVVLPEAKPAAHAPVAHHTVTHRAQ